VFAYWAALLDPRTKWVTVCLLLEDERKSKWCDIRKAIVELLEGRTVGTVPAECLQGEAVVAQPWKKRRGAASCLFSSPGEGTINDECEDGVILLEAQVTLELSYYEKEKGYDLYGPFQTSI
jgi:hypothetical protein